MENSFFNSDVYVTRHKALGLAICLVANLWGLGCQNSPLAYPPSDVTTRRSQDHMSTYVTITIAAPESPKVLATIEKGFAEIKRLERVFSEWKADSAISKINQQAGRQPVVVTSEVYELIETALQISASSKGAFDITFAGLHGLWDFRSLTPKIPSQKEITKRLQKIGYQKVSINRGEKSVQIQDPQVRIGVGGIAKGAIVDAISRILTQQGFVNHLVVAGGDLFASGRKKSSQWSIGIRSPHNQSLYGKLAVMNEGVATSGNYERFFVKDGVRYHHILDPKTGMPARGASSVTIIAPNATLADGYATAAFVMGPKIGLAFVNQHQTLEALFFDEKTYQTTASAKMLERLIKLPPPAPSSPSPTKNHLSE